MKYPINLAVMYIRNKAGLYSPSTRTITINRDIITNVQSLKSVIYHEAIHYIEDVLANENQINRTPSIKNRHLHHTISHGRFFQSQMNRINQAEGMELITVLHTMTMETTAKPFYVYCFRTERFGDVFGWSAKLLPETLLEKISFVFKTKAIKYFVTNRVLYKMSPILTPGMRKMKVGYIDKVDRMPNEDREKMKNALNDTEGPMNAGKL